MSVAVYRPVEEILSVLEAIRDDGVTLPEGYWLMWEIPHTPEADRDIKTLGQFHREDGERRFLDHPIGGITAILGRHAEKEAVKEASAQSAAVLLAEVKAKVKEKGGDDAVVDADLARIILENPLRVAPGETPQARDLTLSAVRLRTVAGVPQPPAGAAVELPRFTDDEIAQVKVAANNAGRAVFVQRKIEHEARMGLKRGKVEAEIAELYQHTPASELDGGTRHVLLEVFHEQPVSEIDGAPVWDVKGQLQTITHLRWKVYRWVEYEAIDTPEELAAVVGEMVEELDARKAGPPGSKSQAPVTRAGLVEIAQRRGRP